MKMRGEEETEREISRDNNKGVNTGKEEERRYIKGLGITICLLKSHIIVHH